MFTIIIPISYMFKVYRTLHTSTKYNQCTSSFYNTSYTIYNSTFEIKWYKTKL